MPTRLTAPLREAPATLPGLAALVLFVVWATSDAGYPVTHWAPGGLVVLVLLAIALVLVPVRLAEMPLGVRVALAALAAYAVLSYLSILWASVPGDAWEGANRTLLYLLVFALFACWPQRGRGASLLVGGWTLAIIVLAVVTLLHLDGADAAGLQAMLPFGRLQYPSGYPNANAAQWLMAFWPALLLARGPSLPAALRGLLAGGAVLLAEVALLSQSRGSLYATPVVLVLVFALLPGRARTFLALVPVALGIAAAAPSVLDVGDHLRGGAVTTSTMHAATLATLLAAVIVGVLFGIAAAAEGRIALVAADRRRLRRGVGAVAIATLAVIVVGGLVASGDPVKRVRHGWDTFKAGAGYAADSSSGSRLVSGLGSNRYDFYRVALDEFLAHPVLGIGVDNFEQEYLLHGRSQETPHYPHSVELRVLSQTGVLGGLLAVIGLAGALGAGWQALRSRERLAAEVAAAALAGFAYWVVHGSFDWFWEFAGLGAPAFALLGISCALAPRRRQGAPASAAQPRQPPEPRPGYGPLLRGLAIAAGVVLAGAAAISLATPWLSQLQIERAARIWTSDPGGAYARLSDAARLNPLSEEAYVVAGSIAVRRDELSRADEDFADALSRSPKDAYATLERGALASALGQQARAISVLERAVRLNPREALPREVLEAVRKGARIDVPELNQAILLKAEKF